MINEKGVYGLISGVITTTILQPFQNIKMALMIPPYKLQEAHKNNSIFNNIVSSSRYIYQHNGVPGFYKGLAAASLKAAFGCYIYFTGLRYFQGKHDSTWLHNFVVSSVSRLTSTFLTNPLNIIETRFQLAFFQGYSSVWSAAVDIYKKQGFKAFFSGGLTSCIKQGAFGGFHYMCYEELKSSGFDKIASGIASGMFATAITHPFQIIRARLQTIGLTQQHSFNEHLIMWQLKQMRKNGGWFAGLAPRLVKKPIANMLTFLMFQIFQDSKKASDNQ